MSNTPIDPLYGGSGMAASFFAFVLGSLAAAGAAGSTSWAFTGTFNVPWINDDSN
jgi:hypothetical protein